jgi:hypothetical protein
MKPMIARLPFILTAAVWLFAQAPAAQAQSDQGWQQKWDAALKQEKSEGKVVVMGPPGERIRDAITQNFAKAFPDISLEFSGARGGELATKIKAERDAGIYSVDVLISGTSTADAYFKPMKALDPIEPVLILPEVANPKNWRDNRLEFSDRDTRMDLVFSTQNNVPLIYNPAQVKPEEVDELYKVLIRSGKEKSPSRIRSRREPGTESFAGSGMSSDRRRPRTFIRNCARRRAPSTETRDARSNGSLKANTRSTLPRERSCTSSKSAVSNSA